MDPTLAAALIQPLAVGGTTSSGWVLDAIEIEGNEASGGHPHGVYVFSIEEALGG